MFPPILPILGNPIDILIIFSSCHIWWKQMYWYEGRVFSRWYGINNLGLINKKHTDWLKYFVLYNIFTHKEKCFQFHPSFLPMCPNPVAIAPGVQQYGPCFPPQDCVSRFEFIFIKKKPFQLGTLAFDLITPAKSKLLNLHLILNVLMANSNG